MLAGTWRLDPTQSRVTDTAGLAGLIGAGAPPMLHITQAANGTVVIESPINEGHARLYQPAGKTTTPVGQGGTITMTCRVGGTHARRPRYGGQRVRRVHHDQGDLQRQR